MQILLLNPPFLGTKGRFTRSSRSPAVAKSGTLYYPIWLAYATGYLETEFKVRLIDAEAEKFPLAKVERIVESLWPRLIIVDTSTPSIQNDLKVAKALKTCLPDAFLTLTGTHPTAMPEETLQSSDSCDAVVRGEIDATVLDLARTLRDGKSLENVKGLSFKCNGKIIHNEAREHIQDLDFLPFVSDVYKRHLKIKKYFFAAARHPMVMIFSGRGCPNSCFFCLYPQTIHGRRYRFRSADSVLREFEFILRELPYVKDVGIEDDTFTADVKRTHEICRGLIELGASKRISWWVNTRATLDYDSMRLMKSAGCRLIIPGFESGVQELLDNMKKGISLEDSRQFMKNARKAGLLVHGCFVVGAPGETWKTMEQTLQFAKELNPDTAQFFPLIPYPGTEAYAWAEARGLLRHRNFADWLTKEGHHNTVFDGENLSAQEMVEFCNYARKKFYTRPTYILYKSLQCLRHPQEAKRTFLSGKVFFRHLIQRSAT